MADFETKSYRHTIIENLEKINYLETANRKSSLAGFEGIRTELGNAADTITQAYIHESEKSREEVANLARDMGFAIEGISEDIFQMGSDIVKAVDISTLTLGYKLDTIDNSIGTLNKTVEISNSLLSFVAGKLDEIRHLMTIPNEVQALELADQARIKLALGENKKALEITEKAMNLCSTSIPVTAYHIIALASQHENTFFEMTKMSVDSFAKLVSFKLQDGRSNEELAILDASTMTYPVLYATGKRYGVNIYEEIKKIYEAISVNNKAACNFIERGLSEDQCASMINLPSISRELHWSSSLAVLTDKTVSLDKLPSHFGTMDFDTAVSSFFKRVAESGTPISKELQIVMSRFLHDNKLYQEYIVSTLYNTACKSVRNKTASKTIVPYLLNLEPQDVYPLSKLEKILITEYFHKNKSSISPVIQQISDHQIEMLKNDIESQYVPTLKAAHKEVVANELRLTRQLDQEFQAIDSEIKDLKLSNDKRLEKLKSQSEVAYLKSQEKTLNPSLIEDNQYKIWVVFFGIIVLLNILSGESILDKIIGLIGCAFLGAIAFPLIKLLVWILKKLVKLQENSVKNAQTQWLKIDKDVNSLKEKQVKIIKSAIQKIENYRKEQEKFVCLKSRELEKLFTSIHEKHYSSLLIHDSIIYQIKQKKLRDFPLEVSHQYNDLINKCVNQINSIQA